MSYDLGVMSAREPMTREQAAELYGRMGEEQDTGDWLLVDGRIDSFVEDLTADYPQIDDLPEEELDDCPWSCAFERGPSWAVMMMVWSRCEDMSKVVFNLSRKHGLALFDPQCELVYLPDSLVETAGMALTCPWLHGPMPASRELITDLVPFLTGRNEPYLAVGSEAEVYMQTLWMKDGYVVEYREGSSRKHYEATSLLSSEEAIDTLSDYALRGNQWRKMHKYARVMF